MENIKRIENLRIAKDKIEESIFLIHFALDDLNLLAESEKEIQNLVDSMSHVSETIKNIETNQYYRKGE